MILVTILAALAAWFLGGTALGLIVGGAVRLRDSFAPPPPDEQEGVIATRIAQ